MKKSNKLNYGLLGTSTVLLSLAFATTIATGIADKWRSAIDEALGTTSFITNTEDAKYVSTYQTGEELMNAAKALSVREGEEGTVIMKNTNSVLPLTKNGKVAVFGGASYDPYMSAAGNTDQVKLISALTSAGYQLDSTVQGIYDKVFAEYTETTNPRTGAVTRTYTWSPNKSAGDYTTFKIKEANPDKFVTTFGVEADWKSKIDADVGIVTFCRPGGEGTTYKPGSALDVDGNATGKNPLAFSADELALVKAAKETCGKVVVLLNTSCTFEVGPLVSGEFAVDGIVYVGIPNDYQFKGIVNVLGGDVNPTGALADTYATDSTSSPAMMNFGGGYYSDYQTVSNFTDARWPGVTIGNDISGSFGGTATYSGGFYVNEVEGIYTGYSYYETRYYDGIANTDFNAISTAGSTQGGNWSYAKEVSYPFGFGLSYLEYEEKLESVVVEDRIGGDVTARIAITNKGDKAGKFRAELFVQSPYTQYDITNKVEKSAIQFLNSEKVDVAAGETEVVELVIPTKYLASYDYTKAKTYIMDAGTYYFAAGNGAHDALNNILTAQGKTGDVVGDAGAVKTWTNTGSTDVNTYSVSDSGGKITNVADNADLNYYLPGSTTYLSRSNWTATYPKNYNTSFNGTGVALADSPKQEEWLKELRNQQHVVGTTDTVDNVDGVAGPVFDSASIGYDQITNIDDPYWENLVNAIPAEEALGAVAHGGSQSDTLTNIANPIVKQFDGPNGFNGKSLSTNNGASAAEDKYFVDPTTEAGAFKACVNSQTLLGSSFSPKLALDWGRLLGNTGLWISCYQIWGAALNYHRTPYNGRNTEYPSEDPMLCNILGTEITKGSREFGIISGPKHIGFNDQEHDRSGISVYMNEQKLRETDLRGFQGSVEEGGALGLMVAFNRIGAINASHHVGVFKDLVRGEWGFKGLISTDMMNNKYYFNPESAVFATITQMADFAGNNSHLNLATNGADATWTYLSPDSVKADQALVDASRQAMKYQLYAFANSAILNISTIAVTPWWETTLDAVNLAAYISGGAILLGWGVVSFLTIKKKEEK